MITGNEPISPQTISVENANSVVGYDQIVYAGLTKREHFAAMAMQVFCSAGYGDFKDTHQEYIAQLSVKQADALIAELNQPKAIE